MRLNSIISRTGLMAGFLLCGTAQATIPAGLRNACTDMSGPPAAAFVFCDDGVPNAGGRNANLDGSSAVTVPARYDTDATPDNAPDDEYVELPPMAPDAATMPGAAPAGPEAGTVAIDLDVSYPTAAPPPGGHPVIFYTHGCCSGTKTSWESTDPEVDGQRWHYNNAWFASRGYVVVNMTVRGFTSAIGGNPRGSTGESGLMSRSFEINDYQHIACQLHADMEAGNWDNLAGTTVAPRIDPEKVVVTGGSYAGGFSYLAYTDPIWHCNAETGSDGTRMKLVAAAPMYTWTDLVQALVPTGRQFVEPGMLPPTDGCGSGSTAVAADGSYSPCSADTATTHPLGIPKATVIAGLFGTGAGATFPPKLVETFGCIGQGNTYPMEGTPSCSGPNDPEGQVLPEFIRDRSPYYQQRFFDLIAANPEYRIPLMSMGTTTDVLFPMPEHRRMHNRLLETVPDYPLKAYFGDYQHFNQNKNKEWDDLCGDDHHICKFDDYPNGDFNQPPNDLRRTGVISRINRFLDHYAKPVSNPSEPAPSFDVTASVQVCAPNATARWPADEPGERFTADAFEDLSDTQFLLSTGDATLIASATSTMNEVPGNQHAVSADPIGDMNGCHTASGAAEPGIAVFESEPLADEVLMIGPAVMNLAFTTGVGSDLNSLQLNTRLYDIFPDGTALLADRGPRRVSGTEAAAGIVSYALHGNAYRFVAGNRIRFEIFQDEDPGFLKDSDPVSSTQITELSVTLPRRSQQPPIKISEISFNPDNASGMPGDTVVVGSFAVSNNSGQEQVISSFGVEFTNPEIIAGVTIAPQPPPGQRAKGTGGAGASTNISIPRDTTVVVEMLATLDDPDAMPPARAGLFNAAIAHPGHATAHQPVWLPVALGLMLLTVVLMRVWRRTALATLATALMVIGCSNSSRPGTSGDGGGGGSGTVPAGAAAITLTNLAITGSDDGSAHEPEGLPAFVGSVRLQ